MISFPSQPIFLQRFENVSYILFSDHTCFSGFHLLHTKVSLELISIRKRMNFSYLMRMNRIVLIKIKTW